MRTIAPGPGGLLGGATHGPDPALVDRVRSRLVRDGSEPTAARVALALHAEGLVLSDATVLAVVDALSSELTGAGALDPLLRDPETTDVLVNGADEIWVDRGAGLQRVDGVRFRDEAAVRRLAQRLASQAGRRLDDAAPYVDARLPDGVRLHAVLPPIATGGTTISLRVPRRRSFTVADLVAAGSLPADAVPWVQALVRARAAFLVSGGTGCGKTTVLSTLLGLVDPAHRLLLVEDSGELVPAHPHVVRLQARPPNAEGAGAVVLHDLVRQALRMRPDRLVVGEVRGAEVVDLLAALNTGHEGGCGTVHANSAVDVPARLEALALAAGLGREALHAQVSAGLDAVVHLVRGRDGLRRIDSVHVLTRIGSWVEAVPALLFAPAGVVEGPGAEQLRRRLELA
ncbi:MAG TPA: TadA family conjugal transfer-associated ATPase [Candidatus Nanopelagicales bacterium]|jgi:pilus assembly protein CpaF